MVGSNSLGLVPRPTATRTSPPLPISSSSFQDATTTTVIVPKSTLTGWNAAMALFHAALAILTLAVGNSNLQAPVYKTALNFTFRNATDQTAGWDLVPVYQESFSLPLTWSVALFFVITAVCHLGNATLWRAYYLRELAECRTPSRWTEYFFSAGLMMFLIAYSLGVRERSLLLCVTVLVSVTMPFGYWTEVVARPASPDAWRDPLSYRLFPWILGHVPQTVAWLVVLLQFYDVDYLDLVPGFVHAILWGELVLFFSFGGAALWSQLGPPRLFYRGELLFQVLSLVSKGILGGILLVNVLMLSQFDDIYAAE